MITKISLIEALDSFPEEFSIDELIERLILIQKVENARKESLEGKKYPENEARKKIKNWSQ